MKLTSTAFGDNQPIPSQFAFCKMDARSHATLSDNINPDLSWSNVPAGTHSLALLCHDPDVPSRGEDVNKEGTVVPTSLPRVDFFHWILVDLPSTLSAIARGEFSRGVTARGKSGPNAPHGARQGINDYTGWFAGDKEMAGNYFGYDGPCPPWNDERAHRYVFTLYALDVARAPLEGIFNGQTARQAISKHVLAQASFSGRYTLNPSVKL